MARGGGDAIGSPLGGKIWGGEYFFIIYFAQQIFKIYYYISKHYAKLM